MFVFSQVLKDQAVTKNNFVLAEENGEADIHHHKEEEEDPVEKEVSFLKVFFLEICIGRR